MMLDYLCDDCRDAFNDLKANLDAMGIEYVVDPGIVRGLDYYTKTAFEFVTTKNRCTGTVCGGGRYDHLVEEIGGPETPGVGFGLGAERLLLTMEACQQRSRSRQEQMCSSQSWAIMRRRQACRMHELRQEGVCADGHHGKKDQKSV